MIVAITIIDLVISLLVLLLSLFVFRKNPDQKINQIFSLTILSLTFWIVSSSLSDISGFWRSEFGALWWARAAIIGPFLFCAFFLYFTYYFPRKDDISKLKLTGIFLVPLISILFFPTDYNVPSVTLEPWGTAFVPGELYFVLLLCLITYFSIGLFRIARSYFRSGSPHERAQLFCVFFGALAVIFIGTTTNLLLPGFWNISQLSIIGPAVAMFIFTSLIAYAILKHHLLETWVVVRMGTVFAILFAIISFIYISLTSLLSQYIGGTTSLLLVSFLITITFEPLKKFVEDKTDRIFFRKHYRVDEVIDELTSIVHKLELDTDKIINAFNRVIKKYFKVEKVAVAIMMPQNFVGSASDGIIEKIILRSEDPIAQFVSENLDFIFNKQELERMWREGKIELPVERIELIPGVFEAMGRMDFVLAIPFSEDSKLIGICFLGEKKSGDWFTNQDIQILRHLIGEIGVFLNNARLYEDLKKLDEAKSSFLSVVSHQLRTPLSAMRWSTELLLGGGINRSRQREFLNDTYKNSIFMIYHLDDMLTALDIEDKEIKLRKEPCDLRGLVQEVLDDNKQLIRFKNLKVNSNLAASLDGTSCDCKKIKKVFEVLISNSINYVQPNGEITIDGEIRLTDDILQLEISVSDDGIGVIAEEEDGIFKKFYRGEAAKKMSPNGFGLGLFIVKSFIKAHGGEIYFESAGRNLGSKFHFSIPCESDHFQGVSRMPACSESKAMK